MSDTPESVSSQDPQDPNISSSQWIAIHNNAVIGFYPSQLAANDGLRGHLLSAQANINDMSGVFQII